MKTPGIAPTDAATAGVRPVFRYEARPRHGRGWVWLAGAAVVVLGVVLRVVLPNLG